MEVVTYVHDLTENKTGRVSFSDPILRHSLAAQPSQISGLGAGIIVAICEAIGDSKQDQEDLYEAATRHLYAGVLAMLSERTEEGLGKLFATLKAELLAKAERGEDPPDPESAHGVALALFIDDGEDDEG